jgi:hypothetical protein
MVTKLLCLFALCLTEKLLGEDFEAFEAF